MKNIHRIGAVIAGLALAYPAPLAMAVPQNTASNQAQTIAATQPARVVTQDDVHEAQKSLKTPIIKSFKHKKSLKMHKANLMVLKKI